MLETVGAPKCSSRVRREGAERIVAVDAAVSKVVGADGAERDRARDGGAARTKPTWGCSRSAGRSRGWRSSISSSVRRRRSSIR